MKLQDDLREFIELLNAHGVRYVIVGGFAVAFHGHPRYTGDIDLFVEASEANSQRIARVLHDFGFGETGLTAADFAREGVIVQLGRPPNRIDLITSIDAVGFPEAWADRVEATLGAVPVLFISKELLLKNKAAAKRAQDIADIDAMGEPS
jgi:predicted nucleotidyltransferase